MTPGTAYFYDVRPYNDNGYGPDAILNPAVTYPGPSVPTGLTAATASGGVNLSWPYVPGATSYNISRGVTATSLAPYTSVGQSPFLDTGNVPNAPTTTPGGTYYYQVTAVDSAGRSSGASNTANAVFPITYTGYLEAAGPSGIIGWAEDTRLLNQTLNVDLYDGATLIQSAIPASYLRNDVGAHGFAVAAPARLLDGQTHTVYVKYGGTAINLNDSPKTINPAAASTLDGYIDEADRSGLSGWTQDSARPSTSLTVDLYDGTTFFQTVSSNIARGDVQPGNHGFSLGLPTRLLDGTTHVLHVRHGGTSTELHGSPFTFNPPAASTLDGYFDQADQNGLSGWAQDSAQPSTSLTLDLYDGPTLFQTVPANIVRGDIQPGGHGFSLGLPTWLIDGRPHVLHVRYGGTGTELKSSPRTILLVPSVAVPNFSFETPALSGTSFEYSPPGASWTFNAAGVATNSGVFTGSNPNAPDGVQVAFIQGAGSISQSIPGFVANTSYTITVAAAQRGDGNTSSQTVQASLDGVVVGAFTPTGRSYTDYTVNYTAPTSGSHTLTFAGTNPQGGENTALIDNVRIVKIVSPDFSVSADSYSASLSLGDGNSLDGGPYQSSITTVPYNGFTGAVTLSLSYLDASGNLHSGAPGGMYYWFDPSTNADEGTGLVTISDTSSQDASLSICSCEGNPALGAYTLIVTATSGSVTHTTSMTLTITN